jgi:hypothetical protein
MAFKYEIFSYPKSRRIPAYRREPVTREWLLQNAAIHEATLERLERAVEVADREMHVNTLDDVNVYVMPEVS